MALLVRLQQTGLLLSVLWRFQLWPSGHSQELSLSFILVFLCFFGPVVACRAIPLGFWVQLPCNFLLAATLARDLPYGLHKAFQNLYKHQSYLTTV